jgi:hypothetical protein
MEEKSVLKEAEEIVSTDRQRYYGHPLENFKRIAEYWNVRLKDKLKEPISFQDVGMMMVLMKMAREENMHKRDNYVDIAGYTNAVYLAITKENNEG